MNRRTFLVLTGAVAAGQALYTRPFGDRGQPANTVSRLFIQQPGTYMLSGTVRLDSRSVEISGITNKQSLSWAGIDQGQALMASFMSFEQYDRPGMIPNVVVRGGRLESLTAQLVD
jgi:hypothetical protein